jgi:hypothetical protein
VSSPTLTEPGYYASDLRVALGQGDADQGRDDALGGRLDLEVLAVAVVIPLGQQFTPWLTKTAWMFYKLTSLREVVADRCSERGTRHGRTRQGCRRRGHRGGA